MNNSKDQFIQDLTNGSNYKPKDNQIYLILFVDSVTYVKSVNRSMWAIFSCIAELPPSLRHSSENIIFHSIWSGAGIDFNLFLEVYNKAIDEIVNEGIFFEGKHINVQILGIIADSPARSKICNTIQFNGKFGCNFCLHPTARNTNNTGQIYPLMENIKLRTNKRYKRHLKKAIEQLVYKGIKGATNILEDESDDYNFNNLSRLTFKHLKKFVKKVKLSSTFVLVKSKFIIRRAYLIETESDILISTTVDLNEHD
jgi:hypothetical protein